MENNSKKPDGRRVKMTKLLLKQSLLELMKQKSIHDISIKEVCLGADINRSTFYRHYNTQYELYDEIVNEILRIKNDGISQEDFDAKKKELLGF